ncbi:glycosyltransferase [Candidatus Pacearchaeota archaeon]|nr:glycosyltransferase [Candidatus Pacearchaeota archaeon]
MSSDTHKVCIVIPAHNEETRIGSTLERYISFFNALPKSLSYQIFVSINATTDDTEAVVQQMAKQDKHITYNVFKQGGKGFAIIEGCKHALKSDFSLIGFVDADGATPPEAFYALIQEIGKYDGTIASRWLSGSIIKTRQSTLRRITSRGFNFIVRSLFLMPYRDTQCGAKLFKRRIIEAILPRIGLTRWAFDVDLLYQVRKAGFKIREIPTIWDDKKQTKLNLIKAPFEMFTGVLRLRLLNSPFNFIIRAYDTLPEMLKVHHRL